MIDPESMSIREAVSKGMEAWLGGLEGRSTVRLTAGKKNEPSIEECVTRLIRYIEVKAKDMGERMERSKQFASRLKEKKEEQT